MFQKRKRLLDRVLPLRALLSGRGRDHDMQEFIRIDFAMMKKGHIIRRGRAEVRQIGVTVNGSTHLVTSGDLVDRETYEALLAADIIRKPGESESTGLDDSVQTRRPPIED